MRVAAFVLAGGMSRRMGRDKAFLPFERATLIQHVAEQALAAAGNVALVGRPEQYRHLGLPVLAESFPGCGPLSGIEAALRQTRRGWALVLACDMPGITAAWLRLLIAAAAASSADAVVTSSQRRKIEPLCALYHARLHADVRAALQAGRFAVRELLANRPVELLPATDESLVRNVNTPQEWAAWSR